ncbi:hypothetical protein DPMN_148207 [Dreissena polymorpha]|uniref:Uncharacterized protein n=1 Tax=Dreissena polymorpha TaxID=45954 RepID=A0A9D4FBE8_DREPO|nr:hypothetical protein DPMN_148207 [Dreissena polymorpha]
MFPSCPAKQADGTSLKDTEERADPTFEPTTTDLFSNTRFEPPPYGDFHRHSEDPYPTDDQLPILSRITGSVQIITLNAIGAREPDQAPDGFSDRYCYPKETVKNR